jgi:hypothetical protein
MKFSERLALDTEYKKWVADHSKGMFQIDGAHISTVLIFLKEKGLLRDVDEPCEYCRCWDTKFLLERSEKLSFKRDAYPGISLCIDNDCLEVDACPDTYEPSFMEASVKINYCPMCGRKLDTET